MTDTFNRRWSLDVLYNSFDDPNFLEDIETLKAEMIELQEQFNDAFNLETFWRLYNRTWERSKTIETFASLSFATDTGNQSALRALNQFYEITGSIPVITARAVKALNAIEDFDTLVQRSEYLSGFSYVLTTLRNTGQYILPQKQEEIISKMTLNASTAWSTLQSQLISTLTARVLLPDGEKTLPISTVRNLATDASQDIRKAAYTAELSAYEKIAESVAMSLNSIKGEVKHLNALRGYTSSLEKTLIDSRMSQKTLDAMLNAMQRALPKFHTYLRKKAELLGHKNGLPFYDLFAPLGKQSKHYTYEEAVDFVEKHFASFSPAMSAMVKKAAEENWIDVEPRIGKLSGAFCASLHEKGQFRILHNFTGSLGDVITLAHELGHGYHALSLNDEAILNTNVPMPLAETASTFCETLITQAALKDASPEEAFTLLEASLQDATQVICDIYSRFLFESEVFEKQPLSVSALNQIMLKAQKEAYGNGLDHDVLHPYMWLIKPHYYDANLNFYNFPYAFGLLFAKGLYAKYLQSPETFVPEYDALLKVTGKLSIVDVCKRMHIDVESSAFWDASFDILFRDIEKFIQLSEEVK